MMKLHALKRLLPYSQPMSAPVRWITTTRYGDYLQVGDKAVFVPGEGSFDRNGLTHLNKEIDWAVFTDGSIDKNGPNVSTDADEETKKILKEYYEDRYKKHPAGVPVKLHYGGRLAPVRLIIKTSEGDYFQAGNTPIFVPNGDSLDIQERSATKNIRDAYITDGSTQADRPKEMAKLNETIKLILIKYYEDINKKPQTSHTPYKLLY